MEIVPTLALSLESWYCNIMRPENLPSFSATVIQRLLSVIVDGTIIGKFVPSGQQTKPDMLKAKTKKIIFAPQY